MNSRIEKIITVLEDKKAEDIQTFDLKETDYFVDYVVIATSIGNKHTYALLDHLKRGLKPVGENFLNIEESAEWIVIDLGDMLIHIMNEETRVKFNLEDFLSKINKKDEN